MNTIEIGKKIKYARDTQNITLDDIASRVGVAKSTIQRYEAGKIEKPKLPVLESIANAINVNPAWLIGKSDDITPVKPPSKKGTVINVLGRVAAGVPIEAVENIIDTEEITEEMARTGEFFGLQIHGDSMEPDIHNGDTVIVRQQDDAENDEIVIALINGNDGVCKRLKKYENSIALVSLNANYEPMYFSKQEIDTKPVKIIGKVVELRRKL